MHKLISMKLTTIHPLTFSWIGFLIAISFFEAPMKFQSPLVSLEIGVSIGQIIFGWMNIIEIFVLVAIFGSLLFLKPSKKLILLSVGVTLVFLVQFLIIMPQLELAANKLLQDHIRLDSTAHAYYVVTEVVKLGLYFFIGFEQLKLYGEEVGS